MGGPPGRGLLIDPHLYMPEAYVTEVTDMCNGQCIIQINSRAVLKCIHAMHACGNALGALGSRYGNVACTAQKTVAQDG